MMGKLTTTFAAAVLAVVGAFADDGVDPGILAPGKWYTKLFMNGTRVTSDHLGGTGWSFKHETFKYRCADWAKTKTKDYKYSTLTISKPGSYSIKGSSEEDRPLRILVNAACTVTLEDLDVSAPWMYSAITIKDGCKVNFLLKGRSSLKKDCEHFYNDDKNEYGCHEYCRVQGAWDMAALTIPQKSMLTVDGDPDGELQIDGYVGVAQVGIDKPRRDRGLAVDSWAFPRHAKFGIGGTLVVNGGSVSVLKAAWLQNCSIYGGDLHVDGGVCSQTHLSVLDENWLTNLIGDEINWYDLDIYNGGAERFLAARWWLDMDFEEDWETALDKNILKEDYLMGLRVVNGLLVAPRGRFEGNVCGADLVFVSGTFEGSFLDFVIYGESASHISEVDFGDGAKARVTSSAFEGNVEIWDGADVKVFSLDVDGLKVSGGRLGVYDSVSGKSALVTGGLIQGIDSNDEVDAGTGDVEFESLRMSGGRMEVGNVRSSRGSLDIEMNGGLICGRLDYMNGNFRDGTTVGKHNVGDRLRISGGSHSGVFTRAPEGGLVKVTVEGSPAFEPWSKLTVSGLPDGYGAKGVFADGDGRVFLWLPSRDADYEFVLGGRRFSATVHGVETFAEQRESLTVRVYLNANQGKLWDIRTGTFASETYYEFLAGSRSVTAPSTDLLQMSRPGFAFRRWKANGREIYNPGDVLPQLDGDIRLSAVWMEITADDVNQDVDEDAAPVDPAKTAQKVVTVRFFDKSWEEVSNFRDFAAEEDYVAGESYGYFPAVTPPEGYELDYWERRTAGGFGGDRVDVDSMARTENHLLFAHWKRTQWTCQFVTETGFTGKSTRLVFATHQFDVGAPVAWMPEGEPTRPRHTFAGWQTIVQRPDDGYVSKLERVTIDTIVEQRPTWVEAVWDRNWTDWTRNRFAQGVLDELVDDYPADPSLVKTVKGVSLVAGLKLVQAKDTRKWYLEGVPTELVDYQSREMYVETTFVDGTKSTMRVKVRVVPEIPVVMRPAFVNENYGTCDFMHLLDDNGEKLGVAKITPDEMKHPYVMASEYWPEATKDWKITGLPSGLKFSTKEGTAWTAGPPSPYPASPRCSARSDFTRRRENGQPLK